MEQVNLSAILHIYIGKIISPVILETHTLKLRYKLGKESGILSPIKQTRKQYIFFKNLMIPFNIKINPVTLKSKPVIFSIRLISEDLEGQSQNLALISMKLTRTYGISKAKVFAYEMDSELPNKPIITLAYAVCDTKSPPPPEFSQFRVSTSSLTTSS